LEVAEGLKKEVKLRVSPLQISRIGSGILEAGLYSLQGLTRSLKRSDLTQGWEENAFAEARRSLDEPGGLGDKGKSVDPARIFSMHDGDNDGFLSDSEFESLLKSLLPRNKYSDVQIASLKFLTDQDDDGRIGLEDFLSRFKQLPPRGDYLATALHKIGLHLSKQHGSVTAAWTSICGRQPIMRLEDLRTACQGIDPPMRLTRAQWGQILSRIDPGKTDFSTYDEG